MIEFIKWLVGGGHEKYRVNGKKVQMRGGGTGPFWGFAYFSDFNSREKAVLSAKKWAADEGGTFNSIV